jgi:hypothetical protein
MGGGVCWETDCKEDDDASDELVICPDIVGFMHAVRGLAAGLEVEVEMN